MSFANIGMRPGYMAGLPRYSGPVTSAGIPSYSGLAGPQVYSPLQTVSGLMAGRGQQEPSDAQQVIGGLQMANTANNAIRGLTGYDPAKEAMTAVKDWLTDPTIDKSVWAADIPAFAEEGGSAMADAISGADIGAWDSAEMFGPPVELADFGNLADANTFAAPAGEIGLGDVAPYLGSMSRLAAGDPWGAAASAIGTYLGGPIGGFIGGQLGPVLSDVGHAVDDFAGDIVSGVGDFAEDVGDFFSDLGGGCFLTTACMLHHKDKFEDDGRELTALRDLRDNYVRSLPEGDQVIKDYYDKAPAQVRQLATRRDGDKVFEKMYHQYIIPAVESVEAGDYKTAYKVYTDLINWVNKETENV